MATLNLLEGTSLAAKAKVTITKLLQTTGSCSTTGKDDASCKDLVTTLAT